LYGVFELIFEEPIFAKLVRGVRRLGSEADRARHNMFWAMFTNDTTGWLEDPQIARYRPELKAQQ